MDRKTGVWNVMQWMALLVMLAFCAPWAAFAQDEEAPAAASLTFEDMVSGHDTECLLPLNNWVPLFRLDFKTEGGTRYLRSISYHMLGDQHPLDRAFDITTSLLPEHIYEFGWIQEGKGAGQDGYDEVGDSDRLLYVWDNRGYPYMD